MVASPSMKFRNAIKRIVICHKFSHIFLFLFFFKKPLSWDGLTCISPTRSNVLHSLAPCCLVAYLPNTQ